METRSIENQFNGKFEFIKRDEDKIFEFNSRWVYTFNIKNDNTIINFGIHQPSALLGRTSSYIYTGLILLKSGFPNLTLIDYLSLKETRQHYLQSKLNKGSYILVPISPGFYINKKELYSKTDNNDNNNDETIDEDNLLSLDKVEYIEEKKTKNDDNITINSFDLTVIAKNIAEEIFEKYDIGRSGSLSWEALKIFFKYSFMCNKDGKIMKKRLVKDEEVEGLLLQDVKPFLVDESSRSMDINQFKNYVFYLVKKKGKVIIIYIYYTYYTY